MRIIIIPYIFALAIFQIGFYWLLCCMDVLCYPFTKEWPEWFPSHPAKKVNQRMLTTGEKLVK